MDEQEEYQARFHRVFKHMIDRLGQPLATAEATLGRVYADLGETPPSVPAPSLQPRTEQGQLIYETLSQAEAIYQSLLCLEQLLLQRQEAASHGLTGGARPSAHASGAAAAAAAVYSNWAAPVLLHEEPISPAEVAAAAAEAERRNTPRRQAEEEEAAAEEEYNFRALDSLSVPYTQMGLQTTLPDQRAVARQQKDKEDGAPPIDQRKDIVGGLETDWDAPCRNKMQKIPWNCKVPVTLTVNIPRKRFFAGDKMELQVEIHNMTDKKIKCLLCTLIKKSTSYVLSQGLRNVNSKKDEEVVQLEVSPQGFPVKGRFRHQTRVFFKLPFSLSPTVSDGQSSFEVVYYLKVRAGPARKNGPWVVLGPLKIEQRRI